MFKKKHILCILIILLVIYLCFINSKENFIVNECIPNNKFNIVNSALCNIKYDNITKNNILKKNGCIDDKCSMKNYIDNLKSNNRIGNYKISVKCDDVPQCACRDNIRCIYTKDDKGIKLNPVCKVTSNQMTELLNSKPSAVLKNTGFKKIPTVCSFPNIQKGWYYEPNKNLDRIKAMYLNTPDIRSTCYKSAPSPIIQSELIEPGIPQYMIQSEMVQPELVQPEMPLPVPQEELITPEMPLPIPQEELITPEMPLPVSQEELITPEMPLPVPQEELITPEMPITKPKIQQVFNLDYFIGNGINTEKKYNNEPKYQLIGDFTIAFYINPQQTGRRVNPINKSYGGEFAITLEIDGTLSLYFGSAGKNADPYACVKSNTKLTWNKYTHVAFVRMNNSKKVNVYFDGNLVNSTNWFKNSCGSANSNSMKYVKASSNPLIIGNGYTNHFKGFLSNIKIYNNVLQLNQIQKLLNPNINGKLVFNLDSFIGNGLSTQKVYNNEPKYQLTGDFTISFFINPQQTGKRVNPINKSYGGEFAITLEINGTITLYFGVAGKNADPYACINSNKKLTWYKRTHVAFVRMNNSKKVNIYFNGNLVRSSNWFGNSCGTAKSNSMKYVKASSNPLTIGNGYTNHFKGRLDDIKIYNYALPINEIKKSSTRICTINDKYMDTFNRTGCFNRVALGWWKSIGLKGAFNDMYAYCTLTKNGTANKGQKSVCCGNNIDCKPTRCKKQTQLKCDNE